MKYVPFLITVIFLFAASQAQALFLSKGAQELAELFGKLGTRQTTQEFAEYGGKKALQETLDKAAQEGGEQLVQKVVGYGKKFGLPAIKVIDHAPKHYVRALDELSDDVAQQAIYAAQRQPQVMTQLLKQHGSDALRMAAKHPGVGTDMMHKLGPQGLRLAQELPQNQMKKASKYVKNMANVPSTQRSQVIDTLIQAPKKSLEWLNEHPRILYTSAGVGTFLAVKNDILGEHKKVTVHPDGSKTIEHEGFIPNFTERFNFSISLLIYALSALLILWGIIKIYFVYKREKAKHEARNDEVSPKKNRY